jgi:voltage-dependent potassium channel beta subunit
MKYRRLGAAGVKLSEIGLGSWLTYGGGVSDDESRACLRAALDAGINFIDTADVYAHGASEEFLGGELADLKRSDLFVATKCFFPMGDNVNDRGLSRKHIHESIDASLRRLRMDYVDLYQCHRADPDVTLSEVVRAMDDLVRRGKILYWGVSEWPADLIREAHDIAAALNAVPPVSNQPEYSIAARRVETNGVQEACLENGLGLVVFCPLKQGLLTGKYSGGQKPADSRAAQASMNAFMPEIDPKLVERVDQLRPIAERRNLSLAQLALAWLLRQEAVTSLIIGASKAAQVTENCGAVDADLTDEDLAEIDALFPPAQHQ